MKSNSIIAPHFIVFEGNEGAGKSTQIQLLSAAFQAMHKQVICTREPGGVASAESIRKLLVEGEVGKWQAKTELLLHLAARHEHVKQLIAPALASGSTVLCDRFIGSTIAYQGYGLGIDVKDIMAIHSFVTEDIKPDICIFLDVPVDIGLQRKNRFSPEFLENRYEKMEMAFHESVYRGFQSLIEAEKDHWVKVDATYSVLEVHQAIIRHLNDKSMLDLPVMKL